MSNYSPRSHFEFGRTALFSSQQVLLLSEILFVHLLACWPSCPILTRVKAAEFRASSVLLCVGITSSWTAKGIPHDLFSAWAVGYVSRAWGTKVWNCKFCQRWREMSWLAKIAVLWELISVLYFTRPSLLSQHPYACWDCWVTSLSPIDYLRAGTSPSHLCVPGAEHSDQQVNGRVHECMNGSFSTGAWEHTTSWCFAFPNGKCIDWLLSVFSCSFAEVFGKIMSGKLGSFLLVWALYRDKPCSVSLSYNFKFLIATLKDLFRKLNLF